MSSPVLYRLLLRVSFRGVPGVDELGILLLPPVAEAPPTAAAPSSLPEAPAGDTEGLLSLGVCFFEAAGGRGRQQGGLKKERGAWREIKWSDERETGKVGKEGRKGKEGGMKEGEFLKCSVNEASGWNL